MTKLKTIAAIAASTLALGGAAVATTAQAQPWNPGYSDYHGYDRGDRAYDHHIDSRLTVQYINGLDWKIDRAARQGLISWRDARDLRAQLQDMKPIAWRAQTGRARPWEINRLERFVNRVDSLTNGYAYNTRRWR